MVEVIYRTGSHVVVCENGWYNVYREELMSSVFRGFFSDRNKAVISAIEQDDAWQQKMKQK